MFKIAAPLLLFTFAECKKEQPQTTLIIKDSNPIVWMYDTETGEGLSMNNYTYKNTIIQGNNIGSNTMKIWALSLTKGDLVWETEILPISVPISPEDTYIKDNYLALEKNGKVFVIDIENGDILWNYEDANSTNAAGISIIGNHIYLSISYSRLIQFDIRTGSHKTIISLTKDDLDNFDPRLSPPSYWKHPSGDDILLMGNRSSNGQATTNFDRYDMLAYNLSADSMLWYKKGIPGIRGSISAPLVHANRAVFYVERNVECINPLNGESIWTHTRHPDDNFSAYKTANITLWKNILIANPDSYHLYGIDIYSGNEIWVNPKSGTMPNTTRIAMDKIWYSSGGVNCYDAQTGKTLIDGWRYKDKGSWLNPIAIDEKTGYIYTAAEGVIFCLDSKLLMKK